MNTASASEAVSNANWVTPTTSATTQSWPLNTGYEQYYNYYQSVPPPTTTSASTTNYQQDYSQAWDEYYKAYYGQSYSTPTTTQYPTNYSYDQYGYVNFSAPPPNYYDPPPQSTTYDYSQPAPSASTSYPAYNTSTVSIPPTTNWSEPPPSFSQPSTYNNAQSYEQPQSFNQPPPISSIYESPIDNSLQQMQQSTGEQQINSYCDPLSNKQQKFSNSKMYENNSNCNFKLNQSGMNNPTPKESSYLEQFPPPPFGSSLKQNNRGRGNTFGNIRGRQQAPRNNLNFNPPRNMPFNRGTYSGKNNNDRRQFNNDFSNDITQFSNVKQNNMGNKRGNRGGFNTNKGYQQRNTNDPWYQQNDISDSANETGFLHNEFEEQEFFHNSKDKNPDFDDSSYQDWNADKNQQNQDYDQNYPQHNIEGLNQKREFDNSKYLRNLEGPPNLKHGFDNQDVSRMNASGIQQRNGGFFQNNRTNLRQSERNHRPFQRQQLSRAQNIPVNKLPIKLMDVVVQLSTQSPVIKRRQGMVDQWQRDIKEVHNRRVPINYFWPVIKSALSAEIQDMLLVNCYSQNECIICEIMLDDIFLVQGRGDNEEFAIESASKMLFEMFKNRAYVVTCTREADGEVVPGFSISPNQHGSVNLPPICRNSDIKSNNAQFLSDSNNVNNFNKMSTSQLSDPGMFLVLESSTNERDQSIASLVATARFNNSVIDYQHEKLPHAPHISLCVITIDGVEIERHEARDYLVAKRQAADKVIVKLKQTRPQITLRLDKAKLIKKEEIRRDDSFEKAISEYLQAYINSNEDIPLKFDCDFSIEEKNILTAMLPTLNLSYKSEGKNIFFIFKQFSIVEMKRRLLSQGFCAQYQLIEKGSDFSSQ